ncbi:MAG: hypothetical protein K0S47_3689 [Herbinix sp.]|jgi:hypothetical protein|nr:hypothetical protein [Herbinix sp.]
MDQMKLCQSCGMPLGEQEELYGTNADGSREEDYCIYCWKDGEFTSESTMEEMIEFCVPHMVSGNPGMTEEAAKSMMFEFFPTLKRWKTM